MLFYVIYDINLILKYFLIKGNFFKKKYIKIMGNYKFLDFIRSFDLFGYPIELSFKNKHSHTTVFGGLLSFLFLFIFLFFTIISCYDLFSLFSELYPKSEKSKNRRIW